ncbi:sterol carrier protein domain-containing protein, partial [Amnibacterium sp.]|uniref:sterol carrier protein domain-containing protein n=1 Tax=Amnibacterium sp. TaxID=1872496 RepID=UPI003F7C9D8E
IYARYGFGPATWSTDLAIDTRRAGWIGGDAPGRLHFVGRASAMDAAQPLFAAARGRTVGDVEIVGHRFARLFGAPSDAAEQRRHRFVRYDDEHGVPRGLVVYRMQPNDHDFASATAVVQQLVATTDDAYRALWQHLVTLDLVATVQAPLRTVDEPLRWLVRDPRMIRTTELREHLWVRVLDPVAALSARSYGGAGRLGLRIADPLGHAQGSVTIDADSDGRAVVVAGESEEGPLLDLPVDALGTLLLGGASAVVLAAAGRLRERAPGDAAVADRLLRSPVAPALMTWF